MSIMDWLSGLFAVFLAGILNILIVCLLVSPIWLFHTLKEYWKNKKNVEDEQEK